MLDEILKILEALSSVSFSPAILEHDTVQAEADELNIGRQEPSEAQPTGMFLIISYD